MKYRVYELEMTTKSPLFSGEIKKNARESKRQNRVNATRIDNGHAVVNIHGPMRAYLEKILRDKGTNVCDTGKKGAMPCGRCVLCDLFGSMGKAGRVMVDDMVSEGTEREIVEVTTHTRLDRETKAVSDTLQMEEIVVGAKFKGRIIVFNPTNNDDNLIDTALNAINEFGVGGWVNRGHGRVDIKIINKLDKTHSITPP